MPSSQQAPISSGLTLPEPQPSTSRTWVVPAFLGLLVCFVAISNQSLWIDETLTAVKAMAPGFSEWWARMVGERASDLQMPFYMVYMWGYAKVFGAGEWALRMANLPWFVLGVGVFAWGLRKANSRTWLTVAFVLFSPFAWYYLDEARPYAMQLGAALVVAGGLLRMTDREEPGSPGVVCGSGFRFFIVGVVVLSGTSMLGMLWAGAAFLMLPVRSCGELRQVMVKAWFSWAAGVVCLAGLGGYYLWTLHIGARATAIGASTVQSTLFIFYEIGGFAGLGPGRLELRAGGVSALVPWLPWIVGYAGVLVAVLVVGERWGRGGTRPYQGREDGDAVERVPTGEGNMGTRWNASLPGRSASLPVRVGVALALPAVFILAVGFVASFRVLGRHFTPLVPVFILVVGNSASLVWNRRGYFGKVLVIALLGFCAGSCLEIRFAQRHAKDDYRQAARLARQGLTAGNTVWWNAAEQGASYYGLPVSAGEGQGLDRSARRVVNPSSSELNNQPEPNLIITSKPDVYDIAGTLREYLTRHNYVPVQQMPAFVAWKQRRGN